MFRVGHGCPLIGDTQRIHRDTGPGTRRCDGARDGERFLQQTRTSLCSAPLFGFSLSVVVNMGCRDKPAREEEHVEEGHIWRFLETFGVKSTQDEHEAKQYTLLLGKLNTVLTSSQDGQISKDQAKDETGCMKRVIARQGAPTSWTTPCNAGALLQCVAPKWNASTTSFIGGSFAAEVPHQRLGEKGRIELDNSWSFYFFYLVMVVR